MSSFKKNFLIANSFNQLYLCLKYFRDTFFDLCFFGPVGFDDHLTDSTLASTLFASANFGKFQKKVRLSIISLA